MINDELTELKRLKDESELKENNLKAEVWGVLRNATNKIHKAPIILDLDDFTVTVELGDSISGDVIYRVVRDLQASEFFVNSYNNKLILKLKFQK